MDPVDLQDNNEEIDNEFFDEDENALRCSICGIRVDDKQLICPVCHSVIRHDLRREIDDSESRSEKEDEK